MKDALNDQSDRVMSDEERAYWGFPVEEPEEVIDRSYNYEVHLQDARRLEVMLRRTSNPEEKKRLQSIRDNCMDLYWGKNQKQQTNKTQ